MKWRCMPFRGPGNRNANVSNVYCVLSDVKCVKDDLPSKNISLFGIKYK